MKKYLALVLFLAAAMAAQARMENEHGGVIHGFEEQPIPRGVVTFENCLLDIGSPIELKNADIDLDGVIFDQL